MSNRGRAGLNLDKVKKNREAGLITGITSQMELENEQGSERAPVASPPLATPVASGLAPALKLDEVRAKKCGWYISSDILDEVASAVATFKARGARIDGSVPSAGALVEPALRKLIEELRREHNGGQPFSPSI